MQSSVTIPRTSRLGLLLVLAAAGAAAAVLGGDAAPPASTPPGLMTDRVDQAALDLGQLEYLVVTRSGTSATSCQAAAPTGRVATFGVPTLIDVNGDRVADHVVTLVVAPATPGTTVVDLNVDRLPLASAVRARVEAVVAPVAGSSGRISFGYDGCEAGAPAAFEERITTSAVRLGLNTTTSPHMPALSLVGSEFTQEADGTRTESRAFSARVAPMPTAVYTAVKETGPDTYFARIRTRRGANVRLQHTETADDGDLSTVNAEIGSFPGGLDVNLSPTLVDYTATDPLEQPLSQPVDFVDIETVSRGVGDPVESLRARLEQVPATGRLERTSPTRVEMTAPQGPIGAATVSYSSVPDGTTTVPDLDPVGSQYLVARKVHDLLVAKVRVEGLSHALVDAGDPLAGADPATGLQTDRLPTVVEATHRPGPFVIDASVTSRPAESPADVTRTAVARVLDLPGTARVEFGATTQSFAYSGSADIGSLTADVTSTEAFVDDATEAHLTITDFPTGLTGRFDETGKRFTARVPQGEVGLIELRATSGPDLRLPAGVDGLRLEDHDGVYSAFARLSGLRRITVGWGDTQVADVVRAPGRFDIHVDIDDPDTADPALNIPATDLDLDVVVLDLPGTAKLEYTPSRETGCPASPCPRTASKLNFTGDGPVGSIDVDVASGQKLIEGGEGNKGASELHGLIRNIPAGTLDVAVDGQNKKMTAGLTAPAPGFVVEVEACSAGKCGTPIETLRLPATDPATMDGLWLSDLEDSYHLFGRISGLTSLTLDWSDHVVLRASKKPGPFDIVVNERKLLDEPPLPTIPYEARTSVAIRDLPATIDLTYAKDTRSLTYNGSDPIGSLEAWRSVDRVVVDTPITDPEVVTAIAGRATEAHALITGIPRTVTLTASFAGEEDESEAASVTLTASPGTIGSIAVELTSDESLLSAPAVQAVPVMSTDDGLLSWDLDDGDADTAEPVEDPYILAARVTELRSFHFEKYKVADAFRDQVLFAEANRDTRRNIWIDVVKPEDSKLPRPLDGLGQYKYEYLRMGMDVPPNRMKFEALVTRRNNGDFRTLKVFTHADADATSMTVETDAGSESLTAFVAPVPAGATYADPGAQACISPGSMDCQPDHRVSYAGSEPVSVALDVAKPVHIDVVRIERKPVFDTVLFPEFHVHMDVEKFMQASKEVDFENCNEYFLFVDTQGHGIQGDITDYTSGGPGGGTDLDIELPPGTMAEKRWIKLEGPPCHSEILAFAVGDNPRGDMSCPSGMDIEIDAFEDIDVHVEDEICPEPRISRVEDAATGQPVQVSRGSGPLQLTMNLFGRGFAPITCSPSFAEWPPCTGPAVRIGQVLNGTFIADDRFEIVSRTWHWTDHVSVVVDVDPSVPVGNYVVFIDNPETGTHRCLTQEVDGVDKPCFSVVD